MDVNETVERRYSLIHCVPTLDTYPTSHALHQDHGASAALEPSSDSRRGVTPALAPPAGWVSKGEHCHMCKKIAGSMMHYSERPCMFTRSWSGAASYPLDVLAKSLNLLLPYASQISPRRVGVPRQVRRDREHVPAAECR